MLYVYDFYDLSTWGGPREDAGGLSREYVLRIPTLSQKATKGAPLYSHSR